MFGLPWLLTERGSVTGEFCKGSHRGFGEFCGQYPFTSIRLRNYSIDGEIWDYDINEKSNIASFSFGNQFEDVDVCQVGVVYKFSYHKDSRPSDTTSGDDIEFYVLDSIEQVR